MLTEIFHPYLVLPLPQPLQLHLTGGTLAPFIIAVTQGIGLEAEREGDTTQDQEAEVGLPAYVEQDEGLGTIQDQGVAHDHNRHQEGESLIHGNPREGSIRRDDSI